MIAETEKNVLRDYFNKSEVKVVEEIDFEKKNLSLMQIQSSSIEK